MQVNWPATEASRFRLKESLLEVGIKTVNEGRSSIAMLVEVVAVFAARQPASCKRLLRKLRGKG